MTMEACVILGSKALIRCGFCLFTYLRIGVRVAVVDMLITAKL